jgi:hypothetical protein
MKSCSYIEPWINSAISSGSGYFAQCETGNIPASLPLWQLERFSSCYTSKPMLLSGFLLKTKPPSMMLPGVHVLENRSKKPDLP